MTREKLNQLYDLLSELKEQRLKELDAELCDLDDYDCLIEHIDAITTVLEYM